MEIYSIHTAYSPHGSLRVWTMVLRDYAAQLKVSLHNREPETVAWERGQRRRNAFFLYGRAGAGLKSPSSHPPFHTTPPPLTYIASRICTLPKREVRFGSTDDMLQIAEIIMLCLMNWKSDFYPPVAASGTPTPPQRPAAPSKCVLMQTARSAGPARCLTSIIVFAL